MKEAAEETARAKPSEPGGGFRPTAIGGKFPIRTKFDLIKALGGRGATVDVKGGPKMVAEEAADLCFAERRIFNGPEEVMNTLRRTSWLRATTKAMHLTPFPLMGPTLLRKRVGNVRIDGVDIASLSTTLRYPISNTAQLLASLAEARSRAEDPTHP